MANRLNRRKIDLIPVPEWADPKKADIGRLLDAVMARLEAVDMADLSEVIDARGRRGARCRAGRSSDYERCQARGDRTDRQVRLGALGGRVAGFAWHHRRAHSHRWGRVRSHRWCHGQRLVHDGGPPCPRAGRLGRSRAGRRSRGRHAPGRRSDPFRRAARCAAHSSSGPSGAADRPRPRLGPAASPRIGQVRVAESLGWLGNGWAGTRGSLEEDGPDSTPLFLVSWRLRRRGEDPPRTRVDRTRPAHGLHRRTEQRLLDLRTGTLVRGNPTGSSLRSMRFVSAASPHAMATESRGAGRPYRARRSPAASHG